MVHFCLFKQFALTQLVVPLGIFLVTFASCMRVLLFSSGGQGNLKPSASVNYVMVSASVAMFIFGTMDVGFGLRHNLDAFVYFNGPPDEEFAQISYWVNVMKIVCYDAQTFVGDAILVSALFCAGVMGL